MPTLTTTTSTNDKKYVLWLKITPTYCNMKDNDVWQEKYSSVTAERTEENNRLNCLQYANERCRKNLHA